MTLYASIEAQYGGAVYRGSIFRSTSGLMPDGDVRLLMVEP